MNFKFKPKFQSDIQNPKFGFRSKILKSEKNFKKKLSRLGKCRDLFATASRRFLSIAAHSVDSKTSVIVS